jgi:hypothetical protein
VHVNLVYVSIQKFVDYEIWFLHTKKYGPFSMKEILRVLWKELIML